MANQNFTNFTLKVPASGDFLVGYNADGSAEYKTTVNRLLSSYASSSISVTFDELTALSSTNSFKVGQFYTLSDFVTEYMGDNGTEWISPNNSTFISNNNGTPIAISAIAAIPEPLILQAVAPNKLSHIAYSLQYPQDIIHYDPNFTYLDGVNTAKGFITFRKDIVREIECDYDWRNVRFKRWTPNLSAVNTAVNFTQSRPVSSLAPSTNYKVCDVVTYDNVAYHCLSSHISPSTIPNGPSYNPSVWRSFFITDRGVMYYPALGRPGFGKPTGTPDLFYIGGFGQANYYYTFSENNLNLAISNVKNVKIKGNVGLSFQDRYWTRFNNIVLLKRNSSSRFFDLNFEDCFNMTLFGLGTKSDCIFKEVSNTYIDGQFIDNQMYNSSDNYILSSESQNLYRNVSNSIFCGPNSNNLYDNTQNCVIGIYINNSSFENCNGCAFINNSSTVQYTSFDIKNLGADFANRTFFVPSKSKVTTTKVTRETSRIPHYEYYDETDSFVRESIYGNKPLLYKHTDEAITTRLSNITTSDFKDIYTTQNHNLSSYVRNLSCWCYDLAQQMTCISPWNNAVGDPGGTRGAGVLITPRHVYMAAHYPLLSGTVIRFVTQDNQVVDRTILATLTHPQFNGQWPDITLGLLDSDVPATITPVQTLSTDFTNYLQRNNRFYTGTYYYPIPYTGVLYTDQEEKALVADYAETNTVFDTFTAPTNTIKLSAYEPVIVGDSGNPVFLIINNKLALVTVWTGISDPYIFGTNYENMQTNNAISLQSMISGVDSKYGISTNYQISAVDLTSFVKFTND